MRRRARLATVRSATTQSVPCALVTSAFRLLTLCGITRAVADPMFSEELGPIGLGPDVYQSLRLVEPGCCTWDDNLDVSYQSEYETFNECLAICLSDPHRCRSLSYDFTLDGSCLLRSVAPTGTGCANAEAVCMVSREAPLAMAEAITEWRAAVEILSGRRTESAHASLDALNCRHAGRLRDAVTQAGAGRLGEILVPTGMIPDVPDNPFGDDKWLMQLTYEREATFEAILGHGGIQSVEGRDCVFGSIAMAYILHLAQPDGGPEASARRLRLHTTLIMGDPDGGLDLLQSHTLPVSFWDIVVVTRVQPPGPVEAYSDYCQRNPVPPRTNAASPVATAASPGATASSRGSRLQCAGTIRITTLGMQRYYIMHKLSAMRAAWEAVCGVDSHDDLVFEVSFQFAPRGILAEGSPDDVTPDVQEWMGMQVRFQQDNSGRNDLAELDSLDDVENHMRALFRDRSSALYQSEAWLCGEPVYVCTAAARILREARDFRPLLVVPCMTLLHQKRTTSPILREREDIAKFIGHMSGMLLQPNVAMASGSRWTSEQVFVQVGVRLPVVHMVGLHLNPKHDVDRLDPGKVLLFRTKTPILARIFMRAIKVEATINAPTLSLVDMFQTNTMSWDTIASFQAAVLLPHNVHLVRFNDLYALESILFVPSAPFIFEFIYPVAATYGGHRAQKTMRLGLDTRAQVALHRRLHGAPYRLGIAPTAASPGEVLPRQRQRECPYRTPPVGVCANFGPDGPRSKICTVGAPDLDDEIQVALNCSEIELAGDLSEPSVRSLCDDAPPDDADDPVPDQTGPAFDPFDYSYGLFNAWCNIDEYRYWHQFTEYHSLRGLMHFDSAADLVTKLLLVTVLSGAPERRSEIRKTMRKQQAVRRDETMFWWGQALVRTASGASTSVRM